MSISVYQLLSLGGKGGEETRDLNNKVEKVWKLSRPGLFQGEDGKVEREREGEGGRNQGEIMKRGRDSSYVCLTSRAGKC